MAIPFSHSHRHVRHAQSRSRRPGTVPAVTLGRASTTDIAHNPNYSRPLNLSVTQRHLPRIVSAAARRPLRVAPGPLVYTYMCRHHTTTPAPSRAGELLQQPAMLRLLARPARQGADRLVVHRLRLLTRANPCRVREPWYDGSQSQQGSTGLIPADDVSHTTAKITRGPVGLIQRPPCTP